MHGTTNRAGRSNRDWWPNQLNLSVLHQHPPAADPMPEGFDYPLNGTKPPASSRSASADE